jgi:hypothetical protein
MMVMMIMMMVMADRKYVGRGLGRKGLNGRTKDNMEIRKK